MSLQYGVALRTNQVAQLQASVGSAGNLKIFAGAEPGNCAAADPSGLLATITLPSAFLTSANGATTLAGSWTTTATGTGTAQSFRMYDASSTCHIQGNTSTDLVLNSSSITSGQTVTVTTFVVTAGNA